MGNEGSEGRASLLACDSAIACLMQHSVFFGSSPAASTDAIAVASVDTPSVVGWRAITDTGRQIIYQNAQSFGDAAGFTGELPFYELGGDINSRTATACDPYTGPDLSDGVVLVSLVGNCATETKVRLCAWQIVRLSPTTRCSTPTCREKFASSSSFVSPASLNLQEISPSIRHRKAYGPAPSAKTTRVPSFRPYGLERNPRRPSLLKVSQSPTPSLPVSRAYSLLMDLPGYWIPRAPGSSPCSF